MDDMDHKPFGNIHVTSKDAITSDKGKQLVCYNASDDLGKFLELLEDGNQVLYPGCKTFTKLTFLVKMYKFKCDTGLSNEAFDELMGILRNAFPDAKIPTSSDEAKSTMKDLGMDTYEMTRCPNNDMINSKEHEGAIIIAPEREPVCHEKEIISHEGRCGDQSLTVRATQVSPSKLVPEMATNTKTNGKRKTAQRRRLRRSVYLPAMAMEDFIKMHEENDPTPIQVKQELLEEEPQQNFGDSNGQLPIVPYNKPNEDVNKKRRGPKTVSDVPKCRPEERVAVVFDNKTKTFGPNRKVAAKFKQYLRLIAHTPSLAPLVYTKWTKVPKKDQMWEKVTSQFIISDTAKEVVLRKIGICWKVFKSQLKHDHFYKYNDYNTRWRNRPDSVPASHFKILLTYWNTPFVRILSRINKEISIARVMSHRAKAAQDGKATTSKRKVSEEGTRRKRRKKNEVSKGKGIVEISENPVEKVIKEVGTTSKDFPPGFLPKEGREVEIIEIIDLTDEPSEAMGVESMEIQAAIEPLSIVREPDQSSMKAGLPKELEAQKSLPDLQQELRALRENMAHELLALITPDMIQQAFASAKQKTR